ncbi:MAG: hypothetical protein JEZ05_05050 [Tenericutes bacterium]|nr:hypothetical protein [Mycoplasmatota bacterium]
MKKQNLLPAIIFFGAIWGIIEASVGYLLHALPVSIYISGTVLFPVVSYILYKAYKVTDSKKALLAIGGVAAAIKALNFFLPFGSPFKIINPMLAIVMESFMVLMVIALMDKDDLMSKAKAFIGASIGWRLLYLSYNQVQFFANGFRSDFIATISATLQFTLLFGVISAFLALGIHCLDKAIVKAPKEKTYRKISPIISFATLAIAIAITLLA